MKMNVRDRIQLCVLLLGLRKICYFVTVQLAQRRKDQMRCHKESEEVACRHRVEDTIETEEYRQKGGKSAAKNDFPEQGE